MSEPSVEAQQVADSAPTAMQRLAESTDAAPFPPNTPVVDMTAEQQVAYWKTQARKHEGRASERADYDKVKAELDELRQKHMTAEEKALNEAREAARAEGRAEALRDSTKGTVTALLDGALRLRGKSDDQISDTLKYVNTDAFVTDGAPDTKAILAYAESISGPVTGRVPDFGAGQRGNTRADTGLSAGAELFRARKSPTTTSP